MTSGEFDKKMRALRKRKFDKAVDDAKKDKTYLDKPDDQLSPAEREAKKQDDAADAVRKKLKGIEKERFNAAVRKARDDKSYQGVDELDLTPEQARAKALDKKDEDRQVHLGEAFEQYGGSMMDIQKKAREAMQGPSRVIDSAGLANSIQSGVGAKDPQMQAGRRIQEGERDAPEDPREGREVKARGSRVERPEK